MNENVVNHYNAMNQLISTLTKNYKVSFTYDAEGLRTSKTVNGEKTVFVWDGDQVVMELSESGKVKKRYVRGNDLVFVDKGEGTKKQYYVTDPHGNVVQLTDDNGKVTKTYEYDTFENEVKPDKKDDNPFRYCGEYYDKETGEVYLRARYYQSGVGRFLTRDTYTGESDDPESLHLYNYCYNNPVVYVDETGNGPKLTTPVSTMKPRPAKPTPGPMPQPGPAPYMDGLANAGLGEITAESFSRYKSFYAHRYIKEENFGDTSKELERGQTGRCVVGWKCITTIRDSIQQNQQLVII